MQHGRLAPDAEDRFMLKGMRQADEILQDAPVEADRRLHTDLAVLDIEFDAGQFEGSGFRWVTFPGSNGQASEKP